MLNYIWYSEYIMYAFLITLNSYLLHSGQGQSRKSICHWATSSCPANVRWKLHSNRVAWFVMELKTWENDNFMGLRIKQSLQSTTNNSPIWPNYRFSYIRAKLTKSDTVRPCITKLEISGTFGSAQKTRNVFFAVHECFYK